MPMVCAPPHATCAAGGRPCPHGGARPARQKSTCLKHLTLRPCVVHIWSRYGGYFNPRAWFRTTMAGVRTTMVCAPPHATCAAGGSPCPHGGVLLGSTITILVSTKILLVSTLILRVSNFL